MWHFEIFAVVTEKQIFLRLSTFLQLFICVMYFIGCIEVLLFKLTVCYRVHICHSTRKSGQFCESVFSFQLYVVCEDKTRVIGQAFILLSHLTNLRFCLFWDIGCFIVCCLLCYAAMNDRASNSSQCVQPIKITKLPGCR